MIASLKASAVTAYLRQQVLTLELVVLDFDGVLTDNTVLVSEEGVESVTCWRGDGLGMSRLQAADVTIWVLSTEVNPIVGARCRKLGVPYKQGLGERKASALRQLWRDGYGTPATTCYVGNDINDADCLELVSLPIVVADAHPSVHSYAALVTTSAGGRGAVREVCDLIVKIREEAGGNG